MLDGFPMCICRPLMFLHTRGKRQSKQWKHPGSSRHRKRNTVPSAEKLQKGQTINGTYYASLLIQFREYIKLKSRRRLEHPPNYCEFAPSDFHLIPKLKKKKKHAISGTHFRSNNEAIFHLFCFFIGYCICLHFSQACVLCTMQPAKIMWRQLHYWYHTALTSTSKIRYVAIKLCRRLSFVNVGVQLLDFLRYGIQLYVLVSTYLCLSPFYILIYMY